MRGRKSPSPIILDLSLAWAGAAISSSRQFVTLFEEVSGPIVAIAPAAWGHGPLYLI